MSQKSSLTQSDHSVRQALTAYINAPRSKRPPSGATFRPQRSAGSQERAHLDGPPAVIGHVHTFGHAPFLQAEHPASAQRQDPPRPSPLLIHYGYHLLHSLAQHLAKVLGVSRCYERRRRAVAHGSFGKMSHLASDNGLALGR